MVEVFFLFSFDYPWKEKRGWRRRKIGARLVVSCFSSGKEETTGLTPIFLLAPIFLLLHPLLLRVVEEALLLAFVFGVSSVRGLNRVRSGALSLPVNRIFRRIGTR